MLLKRHFASLFLPSLPLLLYSLSFPLLFSFKVVFRGYKSTEQLEQMHNSAIELRTKLVLEQETQEQTQKILDYKLSKEVRKALVAKYGLRRGKLELPSRNQLELDNDTKRNSNLL